MTAAPGPIAGHLTDRETFIVPILDMHVHVGKREHLTPQFMEYFASEWGTEGLDFLDSLTPESLAAFLDTQGVDKAVLLAEYSPKTTGIIPSEFIAGFCRRTDRLIPFGSIDLDSGENPGIQTERCVNELGCRGLKLFPPYGHYYPDDPRILPAYEVCRDLGVPVMFHTGTSLFPGSRIKFGHPLLLDDIADEFLDLTIIICHAGRPFWYAESEWMLRRHQNVMIDISGIPVRQLPRIFPKLELLSDRFIFGSDWPNIPSIAGHVEKIRQLPFSGPTIDRILWENAARVLNLGG